MTLTFEVAWAMGLVASLARAGAFVLASPLFSRTLPVPGRLALGLALGLAFAEPLAQAPTMGNLVTTSVANAVVGIALAFLTGILVYAFEMAGSIIDFTSGLSVANVLDPLTGSQTSVFGRTFNIGAGAVLFVTGADRAFIKALEVTTRALPLAGGLDLSETALDYLVGAVSDLLRLAVQISLPALGVLFLIELALGLGARLAPQANVFILGLPVKIAAAMVAAAVVVATFPNAVDTVTASIEDAVKALVGGPIGN